MYAVTAGSTDPLINMDKDTFYDVMQHHIWLGHCVTYTHVQLQ